MSQLQLTDLPPHLPSCWGDGDQNASMCERCVQAELQPTYYVLSTGGLSPQKAPETITGSDFSFSTPTTGSTCSHETSLGDQPDSTSPDGFAQPQIMSSDGSYTSYYEKDILVPIAGYPGSASNYTLSTAPDSRGHTPPPMQTPPNISFSHHLAYIDQKLLDHVSRLPASQSLNHTPQFPPGLAPKPQGPAVPLSQRPTLLELEQQYITYPQSQTISGVRRTRSRLLRDESEHTPPEENTGSFAGSNHEGGDESDAKRRKLCRYDSTTSAHTFVAKEPASLRKARSLVAGNSGRVSQTPTVFGIGRFPAPPISVPTISLRDAALTRLRTLFSREAKQRTNDTRLMMTAERPNSLMFDDDLRFMAVELLLSLEAPAGDACKPLRRHIRSSLETRFHAVWLLSRYAIRLQDTRFNPFLVPCGKKEDAYQRQLRGKLIKELALGCLAIAAKFHHDFLPPLRPLTADQFLDILGDDHPVSFDDFELVQNAILKSFNYIIYQPTPQAYLQEIWKVCPTLEAIQDGNLRFWRTDVRAHTLELIETCLHGKYIYNHTSFLG
ncbi:hypothetical protein FRC08_007456 [Ceratobasidium sp. 394]|nr:hypothetical protein FRC08_007456 [Ceratobasidium sp. 394]